MFLLPCVFYVVRIDVYWQLLVDPDGSAARLLPLWSTRELTAYAIQEHSTGSLPRGMLHFALMLTLCVAVAWIASTLRLRPVSLKAPAGSAAPRTADDAFTSGG